MNTLRNSLAVIALAALANAVVAGPSPQFYAEQQRRLDERKTQIAKTEPARPVLTKVCSTGCGCAEMKK